MFQRLCTAIGSLVNPVRPRRQPIRSASSITALEARVLPAGSVTVQKVQGSQGLDLVITGDSSANKLDIYQTALDEYVIVGQSLGGTTKINGVSGRTVTFTLGEITGNVIINMGGGNDHLIVRGWNTDLGDMDFERDLRITMGTGNDTADLRYLDVWDDLSVDVGTGTDYLKVYGVRVGNNATIESPQTDRKLVKQRVDFTNFRVEDNFKIDLNYSLAVVNLMDVRTDDLSIDLGSGTDKLSVVTTKADTWDIDGGDGKDYYNSYTNLSPFTASRFESFTRKNGRFS